jgi:hypothetical protein
MEFCLLVGPNESIRRVHMEVLCMPLNRISRSFILSVSVLIGVESLRSVAFAQVADNTADIETSKYTFVGLTSQPGVLVRSGPSENDYPVLKLDQGVRLTVVGMRFDWLKVEPPPGSFCLVAQAFVEKRGDGTVGRITNNPATVRIGSQLVPQMHRVPMRLEVGSDVQIIGEHNSEFYKIAPPAGVYLYVDKKFVNAERRLDASQPAGSPTAAAPTAAETPSGDPQMPNTASTPAASQTPSVTTSVQPDPDNGSGNTFRVTSGGSTETTVTPTVEPGVSGSPETGNTFRTISGGPTASNDAALPPAPAGVTEIQKKLADLETRYAAASQKEITQQPIAELIAEYEALVANPSMPPNAKQIAEFRIEVLKLRQEALTQFAALKKTQEEASKRQQDLVAEQIELEQRVAETNVVRFAAVGRLTVSSLQLGNQSLYRLVDPANSRTIIYVRSNDPKASQLMDKFVGLKGEVIKDRDLNLTYVSPTDFTEVDPAQVNTRVFADYTPPSLVTKTGGQ